MVGFIQLFSYYFSMKPHFQQTVPLPAKFLFVFYLALVCVHIQCFFGLGELLKLADSFLIAAVFFSILAPFWILTIFKMAKHQRQINAYYFYKSVLNNIPKWLRSLLFINVAYSIIHFIVSLPMMPSSNNNELGQAIFLRLFSGHISLFYIVAIVLLTGIENTPKTSCPNGHLITTDGNFCPDCGARINK